MHAFTLKLDDPLFEKVESARGQTIRADFIREVLEMYFEELANNPDETRKNLKKEIDNLQKENEKLLAGQEFRDKIQQISEERIKDLQQSNGFYISQIQLLSDQKKLPEPKKTWYQFWK